MTYEEKKQREQSEKLVSILNTLPAFCHKYFAESEMALTSQIAYARDLGTFFDYLIQNLHFEFVDSPKSLEKVTANDIETYKEYLLCYQKNGITLQNTKEGVKRKISVLKAVYWFFYQKEEIITYPECFDMGKAHFVKRKEIFEDTKQKEQEIQETIELVSSGVLLQGKESVYASKTHKRDMAIIQVLCETGAALSSLVALNVEDVNLDDMNITFREKKNIKTIHLSNEAISILTEYLAERIPTETRLEDEKALFLSLQKTRMTGRAIEIMMKKYCNEDARPMDIRKARKAINRSKTV